MPSETFLGAILEGKKTKTRNPSEHHAFKEMHDWIHFFDKRPTSFCHVVPPAFIFDYEHSAIVYISPSIAHLIGYENKIFLGPNGIIKFVDLIHPNDFKIYNEQIFPKEMHLLNTLPYKKTSELIFSTTLRVNQVSGTYKTLLIKKGFIINDKTKTPAYEFGILQDVSAIKKELSITHTIERFVEAKDCASYTKVLSEDYFPEIDANILSAREKEILVKLSLGTKRREVGEKLFISDNTVANHIKTILRKTNSKNIREAIAICKLNGII